MGLYAFALASRKRNAKPAAPPPKRPDSNKSPAKEQRDQERLQQYQEEKQEEDSKVHEFLRDEKRLLETTAFRDQLTSKGEVVATVNCAGLNVAVADVLRDRKIRYTHPWLEKYGFL